MVRLFDWSSCASSGLFRCVEGDDFSILFGGFPVPKSVGRGGVSTGVEETTCSSGNSSNLEKLSLLVMVIARWFMTTTFETLACFPYDLQHGFHRPILHKVSKKWLCGPAGHPFGPLTDIDIATIDGDMDLVWLRWLAFVEATVLPL
jgi:hypothetical protein